MMFELGAFSFGCRIELASSNLPSWENVHCEMEAVIRASPG